MKKECLEYAQIFISVAFLCSLAVAFGLIANMLISSFWLGLLAFFGMVQFLTIIFYYIKKKDIFDDKASA